MIALAAFAVLATSCVDEIDNNKKNKNSKEIQLTVSTDDGAATKAGSDVWTIAEDTELMAGDMKLTLSATASFNTVDPFNAVETKGTILNNDNLHTIGSFDLYIPEADKVQAVKVTTSEKDGWAIQPAANGDKAEWPAVKQDIDFYAYTGGTFNKSAPLKLAYTTNSTTASEQKDLLYTHVIASENDVNIHFYHALAAVRFVVGGLKEDFEVTKISVKNVADGGTATYNDDGTFTWETSGSATFSQTYRQNAHRPASGALTYFDNDEVASTFFMVPQSVSGVIFEIMIKDANGNEYPVEASVPALDGGWKAGYFYTYSISGGEGTVNVEVSETFNAEAGTKENVGATNTGKLASYVRAIVLANWYNEAGKVVAPYTGTITYNTTDWAEVNGIYYHKAPVAAGATSKDLISSFSVGDSPAPANTGFALHLEMKVMVQAVEYDNANAKVQEAWPEASSVYTTTE